MYSKSQSSWKTVSLPYQTLFNPPTHMFCCVQTYTLVYCLCVVLLYQMRMSRSTVRDWRGGLSPQFRLMRSTAVSLAPQRGLASPWRMTPKVSICVNPYLVFCFYMINADRRQGPRVKHTLIFVYIHITKAAVHISASCNSSCLL